MLAYAVEKQGKSLILSCSDGRTLTTGNWDEVVCFLLMPAPNNMVVVWNIDTFVDDITTVLPVKIATKIKAGGRVYTPDNRKIYYQPSRVFGVNQVNIYSLSRYSNDKVDDVMELSILGKKVLNAYKLFGIEPTTLSSPVAVYSTVLDNLDFPRACDLPDTAFSLIQMCAKTMSREWRDVYQLGHWGADEISDYDLTSAYPYLIAGLPDIRNAKFFKSKTMPSEYTWGEMYGKLKIYKPVSPFIYQPKNCYPIGEWMDSITTEQLWLLNKYGIGEFEMGYGNFFTLPKSYGYPFKETMNKLFLLRKSNNKIVSIIAKAIAVGIGGKLQEVHEKNKLGVNFNSIYARMATSRCMVKVADFIYRNSLNPISITVDGVLAEGKLSLPNIKEMGQWHTEPSSNALVMSLLYQWLNNKKPNGQYYNEIMADISQHSNESIYNNIDMNLLSYGRVFPQLPQCGGDLLVNKYISIPYEIKEDEG